MSLASFSQIASTERRAASRARWPVFAGACAIVAIAAAIQARGGVNLDVAWFMTFAERVLQGARAYIDVTDPNPPAAILVYLPAMLGAAWSGLNAEALVIGQTLGVAVVACLAATSLERGATRDRALIASLIALTIAPAAMFAEREHYAALLATPACAVMMALADGRSVSALARLAAGAAAGAVVAFKPHFATALLVPAFVATLQRRSLRWIGWPEVLGFVATLAAYGATIAIFFPAYLSDALPDALAVYAAAHAPFASALEMPTTWYMIAATLIAATLAARGALSAAARGAGWASVGFAVAYFTQQRYQINHASSAIELAAIPMIEVLLAGRVASLLARTLVMLAAALAPAFTLIQADLAQSMGAPDVVAVARKLMPPDGRLAAISDSMELTFPAARRIGGVWVNRHNSMWRYNTAKWILDNRNPDAAETARLNAVIATDRADLAEDISRGAPDVVMIESREVRLREMASPRIAAALAPYRLAATVEGVELWTRAPKTGPAK
ncbi:MAG: hypothetical protein U1E30_17830 [Rhodoblastus sp.]